MNKYISEKIGEVLAFATAGLDTVTKGKEGFRDILTEKELATIEESLQEQHKSILAFIKENNIEKEVKEKAKETEEKVVSMRSTYLEEKWDDANELLEWTGFHTGAALVHWYLIHGAAAKIESKELSELAKRAIAFYKSLISSDEHKLHEMGHDKA